MTYHSPNDKCRLMQRKNFSISNRKCSLKNYLITVCDEMSGPKAVPGIVWPSYDLQNSRLCNEGTLADSPPCFFVCAGRCICTIFSFAGILSVDLGWAPDRNEAVSVAGWLQSSNVCGRIFTSPVWGLIAARYGIKVVLTITLFSMLIGGIFFGFCTNLIAAISVRFIFFGVLNAWLVLTGPCALAVAGRERQTEVLGLIFAAGCGMQLVGPAVGGWTCGIVEEYPALLPSLVGCGVCIVAAALVLVVRKVFSEEELPDKEKAIRRNLIDLIHPFHRPSL